MSPRSPDDVARAGVDALVMTRAGERSSDPLGAGDGELVAWLADRVRWDLEDDELGLYELVWTLRGPVPDIEPLRAARIAAAALEAIRGLGLVFATHRWPGSEILTDLGPDYEPAPADFADPGEEPYVVVDLAR